MTSTSALKSELAKLKSQIDGKLAEECRSLQENEHKYLEAAKQCEEMYQKEPHRISDIYSICLSCLYGLTDQIRQSCNITLDTLNQSCTYIKNLESEVNLQCLNMDILKERSARRKIGKLACTKIVDKKSSIVGHKTNNSQIKATRLKLRFDLMDKIGCSNKVSLLEVDSKPLNEFIFDTYSVDNPLKAEEVVQREIETFNVAYDEVSIFWRNYTKIIEGGRLIDPSMRLADSWPALDPEFQENGDRTPENDYACLEQNEYDINTSLSFVDDSSSSASFTSRSMAATSFSAPNAVISSNHSHASFVSSGNSNRSSLVSITSKEAINHGSRVQSSTFGTIFGVAKFTYSSNKEDELNLQVGDEVQILETYPDGWSKGVANGNVGFFPNNYVETKKH